jgi:hypothetical protein
MERCLLEELRVFDKVWTRVSDITGEPDRRKMGLEEERQVSFEEDRARDTQTILPAQSCRAHPDKRVCSPPLLLRWRISCQIRCLEQVAHSFDVGIHALDFRILALAPPFFRQTRITFLSSAWQAMLSHGVLT